MAGAPAAAGLSRRQIDRLGDRLRASRDAPDEELLAAYRETFSETLRASRDAEDEEQLAAYRETFSETLRTVVSDLIRLGIGELDSGRLKRSEAVIAKLRRDTRIRLSRMQDIAGCRLIADSKAEQDEIYARLQAEFDIYRAYDIRETPRSGYRAVHVVVRQGDKFVEVQVRTRNQHTWACLSELATDFDSSIKYGGGDPPIRQALDALSEAYWGYDQSGETPPADLASEVERLIRRMR